MFKLYACLVLCCCLPGRKLEAKVISTLKPSGKELDKVCNSAETW